MSKPSNKNGPNKNSSNQMEFDEKIFATIKNQLPSGDISWDEDKKGYRIQDYNKFAKGLGYDNRESLTTQLRRKSFVVRTIGESCILYHEAFLKGDSASWEEFKKKIPKIIYENSKEDSKSNRHTSAPKHDIDIEPTIQKKVKTEPYCKNSFECGQKIGELQEKIGELQMKNVELQEKNRNLRLQLKILTELSTPANIKKAQQLVLESEEQENSEQNVDNDEPKITKATPFVSGKGFSLVGYNSFFDYRNTDAVPEQMLLQTREEKSNYQPKPTKINQSQNLDLPYTQRNSFAKKDFDNDARQQFQNNWPEKGKTGRKMSFEFCSEEEENKSNPRFGPKISDQEEKMLHILNRPKRSIGSNELETAQPYHNYEQEQQQDNVIHHNSMSGTVNVDNLQNSGFQSLLETDPQRIADIQDGDAFLQNSRNDNTGDWEPNPEDLLAPLESQYLSESSNNYYPLPSGNPFNFPLFLRDNGTSNRAIGAKKSNQRL